MKIELNGYKKYVINDDEKIPVANVLIKGFWVDHHAKPTNLITPIQIDVKTEYNGVHYVLENGKFCSKKLNTRINNFLLTINS
jgi:hypothetical protein